MDKISIITTLYKSEKYVPELYKRIVSSLKGLNVDYEIIFVDDCFEDNALNLVKELQTNDLNIKIIKLSRNFGQHAAITAGINNSKGDWTIVIDSDLQDLPEEIPNLYKKALEGFDIVLAERVERSDSYLKKISSIFFSKLCSYLSGLDIDYKTSNFGIYSKKVLDNYRSLPESKLFFPFVIQWLGFKKFKLKVAHDPRSLDSSSYSFSKLVNLAFDSILYSSTKPLLLSIKIGLFISIISFTFSIYIIIKKLVYGIPVSGWASLISSIWLLSGLIICSIGLLGAYLGKVFNESKKRPTYIIEEIFKKD